MQRLALASCGLLLAGCGASSDNGADAKAVAAPRRVVKLPTAKRTKTAKPSTKPLRPVYEVVASNLVVPWDLAFAPDGRIFVTERPGRIRVIQNGKLRAAPWRTLNVRAVGEAGLLGIALSPDFARTGYVYVVGTFAGRGRLVNRVIRLTDRNGTGQSPVVIVDNIPAWPYHAGDALDFGPDGMLYVATADARTPEIAQNPRSPGGKILRYRPDGTIPPDNPLPGSPVYALGQRNPQGLAWHPQTRDLFATEHGPSGFANEGKREGHDELNVILPGANYGWPNVAGNVEDKRFVSPLADWTPAIAPSGLAIYNGREFPWKGNLFVGGLRGQQIRRLVVASAPGSRTKWRVISQQALFHQKLGRIRAVVMAPDGHLYFTTSNRDGRRKPFSRDDRVLRIVGR